MFRSSITNFLTASLVALMTGLFVAALLLAGLAWNNHRVANQIARLEEVDRALFDAQVDTRSQVPVVSVALLEQDDPRSAVERTAATTSRSLAAAVTKLADSEVSGRDALIARINRARDDMDSRAQVLARQADLPRPERRLYALDSWRTSVHELIDTLSLASSSINSVIRAGDARIAALVQVRETAWTIRDRYGLQCSTLRLYVENNESLDEAARDAWIGDRAVYGNATRNLDSLLSQSVGSGTLRDLAAVARAQTADSQAQIDGIVDGLGRSTQRRVTASQWTSLCDRPFGATIAIARQAQREASEHADRLRRSSARLLLIAAIDLTGVVSCGLTAVFVLRRRFARPMKQLIASIDRLSRKHYEEPVPGTGTPDELGSMASALEDLRQSELATERLQQAMNRFTSDASHQMRTPLAILATHLTVLESQISATHPGHQSLLDLREAADRLQRLLVQLLRLARAESLEGADSEVVDLGDVAQDVSREYVQQAIDSGIDLRFEEGERRTLRVRASRIAIHEILANLIDNAIRYNRPGGHVTVRARRDVEGVAVLEVEDDGPGIPASEWPKALTRFYRLPRDQSRPGSGLGLPIVESLVNGLGGRLLRMGDAKPGGLTVRVEFPLADIGIDFSG